MARTGFTFINASGDPTSPNQREEDKPTIRSHAMREVRRRRRVASRDTASPNPAVNRSLVPRAHNLDLPSHQVGQPQLLQLNNIFSSVFSGTAIDLHNLPPDVPQNLQNFLYGFTHSTFPTSHVRYECGILSIAVTQGHPVLLHALSAVGAVYRALIAAAPGSHLSSTTVEDAGELDIAFRYHKQHAINWLRMSLLKQTNHQNPNLVAIVTLLLIIETLSGDIAAANAHRSGLLHLASLSGCVSRSFDSLDADLLMSDIKSASTSLSRPSIALNEAWVSDFDRMRSLSFTPYRPDFISMGSGFFDAKFGSNLGPKLSRLLGAMRNLINTVEQGFDMGTGRSSISGTHFLVLEHQLLSIECREAAEDGSNAPVAEACRIAALLYCNLCLWIWPKNSTLIVNVVSRFRIALLQCKADLGLEQQEQEFLLWLYFMGSYASARTEDYEWFLEGMREELNRAKVTRQDQYRNVLSRFFYVSRLMDRHLERCSADIVHTT